jgi:YihY family inner membrane protein
MPDFTRTINRIDAFQQRHTPLAFVFAVIKKFGDDQGGNLAALLTYYGFLSIFPMMLVLVTVLGYILVDNPNLQNDIVTSALAELPIIGDTLRTNIGQVRGNGFALFVGILITFYGGLGFANAAQNAMNRVWEVPMSVRAGFFPRLARSLGLMGTLGLAIIISTVARGVATASSDFGIALDWVLRIGAVAFDTFLFAVGFKLLTSRALAWRDVFWGALVAGIGWEVLQLLGKVFLEDQLTRTSKLYGTFAFVIGLLVWLFLVARVVLYAAELNTVLAYKLWPRSMNPPPLTEADHRAFELYARNEERRREVSIGLTVDDGSATTAAPVDGAASET